jgi:acyl carrier protein
MTAAEHTRQAVLAMVAELRPRCPDITERTTLAELGCDSLDRFALAVAVEHATGVALTDAVLPRLRDINDVITAVTQGGQLS